jgi:hypothetical protein
MGIEPISAETTTCECGRQTPVDRIACIYCGRELAFSVDPTLDRGIRVNFRQFELSERGFLVVAKDLGRCIDVGSIQKLIPLALDRAHSNFPANIPLPVARLRTSAEATIVSDRMSSLGLQCSVIDENSLAPRVQPIRIRAMIPTETGVSFIPFNSRPGDGYPWHAITTVVIGRLLHRRLDSLEKRSHRRKSVTLEDNMSVFDSPVIDIYVENDAAGFRLLPAGADFSFLRNEMSPLATENMAKVASVFDRYAVDARIVTDYDNIRWLLGEIWPESGSSNSSRIVGGLLTGRKIERSVTVSNEIQFLRFSRLQSIFR